MHFLPRTVWFLCISLDTVSADMGMQEWRNDMQSVSVFSSLGGVTEAALFKVFASGIKSASILCNKRMKRHSKSYKLIRGLAVTSDHRKNVLIHIHLNE